MNNTNIEVSPVRHERDLEQILLLQKQNLAFSADGFVTVNHTLEILREFHAIMPSVVARHNDQVVAYALSMPRESRTLVPVLGPMFQRLDAMPSLDGQRWYVMGQICVAEQWRGHALPDRLYAEHRNHFAGQFDWLITEIAMRNPRSLKAHARVGFIEMDRFRDDTDEWSVVGLPLAIQQK